MNKIKSLLPLCLLVLAACASMEPAPTTKIQKIIEYGKPADQAFALTMRWLNNNFVSAKNVIQYSDKDSGLITGKAYMPIRRVMGSEYGIDYTVTLEIKSNKARLTFDTNFGSFMGTSNATKQNYDVYAGEIEGMAASLEEYIATTSLDW